MESGPELRLRIEAFVAPYGSRVRVVDQREAEKTNSDDLPDWDLGVNFEFDALSDAEKKDIALFFQSLSGEFGRDFIIGGVLPSGQTDDFIAISAAESLDPILKILIGNENHGG